VLESFAALPAAPPEKPAPLSPAGWAELLLVLLRYETFLAQCQDPGVVENCSLLFDDPAAANFLLLHESDGVEWV
jgi:hypothetical protein